jgi:hypothetical protein
MSYSDDLDAINRYFRETPIKAFPNGGVNTEAFSIKDSFVRWYDALGWGDKNFPGQEVYDNARTRRNQFNLALAQTPVAKQAIRDQLATGMETEEMKGQPRPPVDTATGRVGTQVQKPTVAATPSAMPDSSTPAPVNAVKRATLSVGTRGPDVDVWQKFVGISPTTGYYGEATAGKTKNWQIAWNKAHPDDKIGTDGKVGPMTWARAFPHEAAVVTPSGPFAPGPGAQSTVFAPPPAPIGPGGIPKQPTTKPKAAAAAASPKGKPAQAATAAKQVGIKAAGMVNIGSWPLWAKVGAGVTVVGGIAAALMGHHKTAPRYGFRD